MSSSVYNSKHYAENAASIGRKKALQRAARGMNITVMTLKKYNITPEEINEIRAKNGIEPIDYARVAITSNRDDVDDLLHTFQELKIVPDVPTELKFSLKDARNCIRAAVNTKAISESSAKNYVAKLTRLDTLFGCGENLIPCLADYDSVMAKLEEHYTNANSRKDMISAIVSTTKHCPQLEAGLVGVLPKYQSAMKKAIKVAVEQQYDDAEKTAVPWEDILAKADAIIVQYGPTSQQGLIAQLYTRIPVLRDNFGNVFVSKIKELPNAKDVIGKRPVGLPKNAKAILWVAGNSVLFHLFDYKTNKKYGDVIVEMPDDLQANVVKSLAEDKRQWLITKTTGDKAAGQLTSRIKTLFGHTINDLRHSLITYELRTLGNISPRKAHALAKKMLHAPSMQQFYVRNSALKAEIHEALARGDSETE